MATETIQERFGKTEKKFIEEMKSFAAGGYRFGDKYTLYKESQQEALHSYVSGLAEGKSHGYIELPTGVGKTALFISFIKNYLQAANDAENAPRVLIVVPTEKLAVQTAQSFAKFMPEIAPTIETDGDEGQEIDWEKSDVGLQYGKMKHAHKKPKVLITTYQSLALDKANKTYPPEEYGFVIYDEGHVITSPTFGRAVTKFHDSVQLAVSATPEYTETKTVASKLPHLYYQLPLAKAINRGDLCNVRPAIIKTGYRIDEALFQRFIEQQRGTTLNEGQLQQLLNQESRNKSVIETYLRGADPDSGERYFGQNGMVFCTGVKHADSVAEQFKKTLEKPGEGQALKQWLDNEQIELIAPVHGQAEGAWLRKDMLRYKPADQRKFQGEKEWYSEEEIFKLHDQGKILLLASVNKLKWGYDCPRDSLLFDLADRFSKVDATQVDGRAFRLDPDNPDKTATVFNLMDENTEALYEKYPKMLPIYCAEVLEGAEFRPPAKRKYAQVRFKAPPPGMEKSLQEAGFDVITDIDAVRTISYKNKEKRNAAKKKAPPKEDWLSNADMEDLYVGGPKTFKALLTSYAAEKQMALIAEGITSEEAAVIVERDFVGMRSPTTGSAALCASPTALAELVSRQQLKGRTSQALSKNNWVSGTDLAKMYIGSSLRFNTLLEQYARQKQASLIAEGRTPEEARIAVERDFVGMRSSSGNEALCAHPDVIVELVGHQQLKKKDSKAPLKGAWLAGADLENMYIGAASKFTALFERYATEKQTALIAQGKPAEEALALVEHDYVGIRVSGKSNEVLCASPEVVAEIVNREQLKGKNSKAAPKGNWISGVDLTKSYSGTASKFTGLLELYAAEKETALIVQGKSPAEAAIIVARDFVAMRSSGSQEALCASPSTIAELASYGKLKDKDSKAFPKGDWVSGVDLKRTYVGAIPKFIALFEHYAAEKKAALVAEGKTPEEATTIIGRDFVGMRSAGVKEALCASPIAIADLEEANKIQRRDSAQTFAEKVGKRNITPDSNDLRRIGRVRGEKGE